MDPASSIISIALSENQSIFHMSVDDSIRNNSNCTVMY
jgi:hypothetical protein